MHSDVSSALAGAMLVAITKRLRRYASFLKSPTFGHFSIRAERFPSNFHVVRGQSYPRLVVTYHLPFSGTYPLITMIPSERLMWTEEMQITHGEVAFRIIVWEQGAEAIKANADQKIRDLCKQGDFSRKEVQSFNSSLEGIAQTCVQQRKEKLLSQSNLLSSLGVPVRRAGNVSSTFSIPTVKQKLLISKPTTSSAAFVPDPSLDNDIYLAILKVCHDLGVLMERHPSLYMGKEEEALRDHFLLSLSPHFESATGETFNKSGKTDILVRYEGKNAFVGECKFWRGEKAHTSTIDQILSYLTWRDSKSAILYFVDNKQLNPVLETIRSATPTHKNFTKLKKITAESWTSYDFKLSTDETRNTELSILVFHFPK